MNVSSKGHIGGPYRVTLMVAFAFLVQIFGSLRGHKNDNLSFCECSLSS